jgi:tetratricopeptide (TPR) repeat protein
MHRIGTGVLAVAVLVVAAPGHGQEQAGRSVEDAKALIAAGDYAAAEAAAREATQRLESEHGEVSTEVARALDVLVEALWRAGKTADPEARLLGEKALAIKRQTLGHRHPDNGMTLRQLAAVYRLNGKYDTARRQLEEAIVLLAEGLGPDRPEVGETRIELARVLRVLGVYSRVEEELRRGLSALEGTYGAGDPRLAPVLDELASLLLETGRHEEAAPFAERRIAILERDAEVGPSHPLLADALARLAAIREGLGDAEGALADHERALRIREAAGDDPAAIAAGLRGLATHLHRSGAHGQARPLLERALAIVEDLQDGAGTAGVLIDLAAVDEATGDVERARAGLERAVELRDETGGPALAEALNLLGHLLLRGDDPAPALARFRRAAAVLQEAYGDGQVFAAESLLGAALALARTGDAAAALDAALESDRLLREFLRLAGPAVAGGYLGNLDLDVLDGLDVALSLVARDPALGAREVLDAVIRSRAAALDEAAARSRPPEAEGRPTSVKVRYYFDGAREGLANLLGRGRGELDPEIYDELVLYAWSATGEGMTMLGKTSPRYRREQELAASGVDDVQVHLPAAGALVSFVRYDDFGFGEPGDVADPAKTRTRNKKSREPAGSLRPTPSYVAIVLRSADTEPTVFPLGPAADLDRLTGAWAEEIARGAPHRGSENSYRSAAAELRARIWDPLEASLEGARRVFLVAGGALDRVDFSTLPRAGGGYLVEDGRVLHHASAERDLVPVSYADLGRGLLAVGRPAYDETAVFEAAGPAAASAPPACPGLHFDPPAGAEEDGGAIAELWRGASSGRTSREPVAVLSGAEASEGTFKRLAQAARVLHVATRGAEPDADCATGTGKARPPSPSGPSVARTDRDARYLAPYVLAFAGANHGAAAGPEEEDGVLSIAEIATLDLSAVEWVVLVPGPLSAGTPPSGETLRSLRRAMRVAGAASLITAQWPADEEAARAWLDALYRGRMERALDTALAAREASRTVLHARRARGLGTHPFHWAAHVATGDWR